MFAVVHEDEIHVHTVPMVEVAVVMFAVVVVLFVLLLVSGELAVVGVDLLDEVFLDQLVVGNAVFDQFFVLVVVAVVAAFPVVAVDLLDNFLPPPVVVDDS